MAWQEHVYRDAAALAEGLAAVLARCVEERRETGNGKREEGGAPGILFALAGGRTPWHAYRTFAAMPLDWEHLHVVPTDERCVPHDHAACNLRELREAFAPAQGLHIAGLTVADGDPRRSEAHAQALFASAPYAGRDFDAVVLGMGGDGHTASLFPGAPQRAAAMAPDGAVDACRIDPVPLPPEAPFPRITLTLSRLLRARALHLAIVGEAKRAVLREAQASEDHAKHPISALLHAPRTLVHVHWSPA